MASVSRIERLHQTLENRIHHLTRMQVLIRCRVENWKRVVKGSTTSFDMVCRDYTATAERKRGGRCPVFRPSRGPASLEDQLWAGWHEEWHCEQRNEFDLIGVGWTFFWGVGGRLGREQEILRAEWDQVPDAMDQFHRRGGSAAQPHWHLDTGIMAGYSRPVSRQVPAGEPPVLEELASEIESALEEIGDSVGIQEIDLSGMHLGMGGWQNHNDHPRCWQRQVSEDWGELILWAERTLESARDQFGELKIAEIAE